MPAETCTTTMLLISIPAKMMIVIIHVRACRVNDPADTVNDKPQSHIRLLTYGGCDDREPKPGIEPGAFRLLGGCSGQLSYKGRRMKSMC